MGGEPLELLEPIEEDAQLDRPFHCPWRERKKATSVRRRHDPPLNITSFVERPRWTHAQVRMCLDVGDHHSTCAQKQELPAADPYRPAPFLRGDSGPRAWPRKRLHVDVADTAVVGVERDESAIRRKPRLHLVGGRGEEWHRLAIRVNPDVRIAAIRVLAEQKRSAIRIHACEHLLAQAHSRAREGPGRIPDRDGCGLLWCSPVVPMTASALTEVTDLASRMLLDPRLRTADVRVARDRSHGDLRRDDYLRSREPGADAAALACYGALAEALQAKG